MTTTTVVLGQPLIGECLNLSKYRGREFTPKQIRAALQRALRRQSITNLYLAGWELSPELIRALHGLPITCLSLSGCQLTLEVIREFHGLLATSLAVYNCHPTLEMLRVIKEVLPQVQIEQ